MNIVNIASCLVGFIVGFVAAIITGLLVFKKLFNIVGDKMNNN